jgi:hypothetical protein
MKLPSRNIESASRSGFEFHCRLGCLCLPHCRKHFVQHNKMETRLVLQLVLQLVPQVGYGSKEYGQQASSVLSRVRFRLIILPRLVKHTQADSLVVAPRVDGDHWASFFLPRQHFPCSLTTFAHDGNSLFVMNRHMSAGDSLKRKRTWTIICSAQTANWICFKIFRSTVTMAVLEAHQRVACKCRSYYSCQSAHLHESTNERG